MNTLAPKPASCNEIGLHCNQCVSSSARQLAAACGEMSVREVEEIFFAMYNDDACSPMSGTFVQICLSHSQQETGEQASWLGGAQVRPAFAF